MHITFIFPSIGRKPHTRYARTWQMEPSAISLLSSLTPPSIKRTFFDDRIEPIPDKIDTDLVAITTETYTAKRAYDIADSFRRQGIRVVIGGFHATLAPEEASQHCDALVTGAAEQVWPRLIDDLAKGSLEPNYKGDVLFNTLDDIPDRTIFGKKKYLNLGLIETSRGCPFTCEFCSITSFYQQKISFRPIENIINEIKTLKTRNVFFIDDNLTMNKAHCIELFQALIPLKLNWVGQVSLSCAQDDTFISLMRKSGCVGVLIGFESLNPSNLTAMNKRVNLGIDDYVLTLSVLQNHHIAVYGTFLFGYDQDNLESFEYTYQFALQHKLFFAAFNHLVPFPGTPLYKRLLMENRLIHKAWWLAPSVSFGDVVFNPKQITAETLAKTCYSYRRNFYSPISIMKRGLNFKSNCHSFWMSFLYYSQNVLAAFDTRRRQGIYLGNRPS